MKTYLYIRGYRVEQSDINDCQPKAGGLERTHRRQRVTADRNKVEASVMRLAKKARNADRNKTRKAKREAKRKK